MNIFSPLSSDLHNEIGRSALQCVHGASTSVTSSRIPEDAHKRKLTISYKDDHSCKQTSEYPTHLVDAPWAHCSTVARQRLVDDTHGPSVGPQCLDTFMYDHKTLRDRWARTESRLARTLVVWPARLTPDRGFVAILAAGPFGNQQFSTGNTLRSS